MSKTFWVLIGIIVLGFALQTAGLFANHTVVAANQDQMPVWCVNLGMVESLIGDDNHTALTKQTKYPALSDIIPFWKPMEGGIEIEGMISVGDIGLIVGYALFEIGIVSMLGYLIFVPVGGLWKFLRTKTKTVV